MTAAATAPRTATTTDPFFRVNGKELKSALTLVGKAVPRSAGRSPILTGVHVEVADSRVTLTGTNDNLTVAVTLDGGKSDGAVVVAGALLREIVATANGADVEVSCQAGEVRIGIGSAEYVLESLPLEDFPARIEAPKRLRALPDGFVDACKQVLPAVGTDETRPILTGVLLDPGGQMMATDSYRLTVRDLPGLSLSDSVIVPASALRVLAGSDLRAGVKDRYLHIEDGRALVQVRLIEGLFPNVSKVLPKPQPQAVVNRGEVLDAIARARPVLAKYEPMGLDLGPEGRVFGQSDWGSVSMPLNVAYDGPPVTVHFNPRYLADGIKCCRTDEVAIEVKDGASPARLSPVGVEGFQYVLMPVRPGR